jgi:hypothetical protein
MRKQLPTFYLTPHGVQEIEGISDLEDRRGRVVIPTLEGSPVVLERVEFN